MDTCGIHDKIMVLLIFFSRIFASNQLPESTIRNERYANVACFYLCYLDAVRYDRTQFGLILSDNKFTHFISEITSTQMKQPRFDASREIGTLYAGY